MTASSIASSGSCCFFPQAQTTPHSQRERERGKAEAQILLELSMLHIHPWEHRSHGCATEIGLRPKESKANPLRPRGHPEKDTAIDTQAQIQTAALHLLTAELIFEVKCVDLCNSSCHFTSGSSTSPLKKTDSRQRLFSQPPRNHANLPQPASSSWLDETFLESFNA